MTDDLFFDTDCLSSFLWIDQTDILEKLYGGRIMIPGPVYRELSNPCISHMKAKTDALLRRKTAQLRQIGTDREEYHTYRTLVKGTKDKRAIGKGEAAAIALARVGDGILASNNWKDISQYIEEYDLKHIDTGHILIEGLRQGFITEYEGNVIWRQMRGKNRRLPGKTFSDYLNSDKGFVYKA